MRMDGTLRNLMWHRGAVPLHRMSVAHVVVVSLCVLFLSFATVHPTVDLLHANTHRVAATAVAGASGLLNDDLSVSHGPYVPDVHPAATLPPQEGHLLVVQPAFRPEGMYLEPPFHVPV